MAIPLLEYAPITQNSLRSGVPNLRVGSDEGSRAYSLEIADDRDNFDTVVEAGYRQIFFHAFKTDRDVNLESQLKDGQITVRDFIRGLLLSDSSEDALRLMLRASDVEIAALCPLGLSACVEGPAARGCSSLPWTEPDCARSCVLRA